MGKDKKKNKKHKKDKKSKDKKKKRHHSSSSESSSSEEWVEKEPVVTPGAAPKLAERDEWMSMEVLISGKTRSEFNENNKKKDEEKEKQKKLLAEPGQSSRELNPYWKDGGTGLPPEREPQNSSTSRVGDHGVDWLKRSLRRAKEQAEEEGRSLDSVMRDRWGSLAEFEKLLNETEQKNSDRSKNKYGAYQKISDRSRHSLTESSSKRREEWSRGEKTSHLKKMNFKKPDSGSDSEKESRTRTYSNPSRRNWRKAEYKHEDRVSDIASERITKKTEGEGTESVSNKDAKSDVGGDDLDEVVPSRGELSMIFAQQLKAKMEGNHDLAEKLLQKYQKVERQVVELENKSSTGLVDEKGRNVKLLTETDNRGFTRPLQGRAKEGSSKKRRVNTHEGKERVRYFADDDKYTLQDMFEREKYNSQSESIGAVYRLLQKVAEDDDDAFDVARMDTEIKDGNRQRQQAIRKMAAREKILDNCRWCIGNEKSSNENIVLCKSKVYLAVPTYLSLTEGHCLIVPQNHISCATMLDEDVWDEIMDLRNELVKRFLKENEDVIFFESALYIDRHPHMLLHCVPVPKETGDMAPIYFKKALLECESEWTNNKKVVDLAGRNVRKAVPKGLPYFAVDFGMQSGYAHVIEDKKLFPHNFAQEIIGGMLDLDHSLWRKPKRDSPENIKKKTELLKQIVQG